MTQRDGDAIDLKELLEPLRTETGDRLLEALRTASAWIRHGRLSDESRRELGEAFDDGFARHLAVE